MYASKASAIGAGLIMVVAGILLAAFPAFSMSLIAVIGGIALLSVGVSAIVNWFKNMKGTAAGGFMLVFGVLAVILALVCIVHPLATASSFTWLIALCIVVAGIAQTVTLVFAPPMPGRMLGVAGAALTALFGICALAWPPMVAVFIGVSLLVDGISLVALGFMMK